MSDYRGSTVEACCVSVSLFVNLCDLAHVGSLECRITQFCYNPLYVHTYVQYMLVSLGVGRSKGDSGLCNLYVQPHSIYYTAQCTLSNNQL